MRENARTTILLGALAVALAACADQPPPAGPTHDFVVSYYQLPGPGNPPAVAAAVGVLNPDNVAAVTTYPERDASLDASVSASRHAGPLPGLTEVSPAWLVGPVAVIAEDGTVELSLPELDADLEAVLEPVSRLLWDNDALACPLTVSDPSVGVTQALFQSVAVPGVVLFNGFGAFAATLSGAPLPDTADTTLAAADLYGLVYATGPVDVSASGPGCEAQGHTVDVSLEAGWNWVRWEVVLDAMDDFSHAHLTSTDPPQELWATLIPFI